MSAEVLVQKPKEKKKFKVLRKSVNKNFINSLPVVPTHALEEDEFSSKTLTSSVNAQTSLYVNENEYSAPPVTDQEQAPATNFESTQSIIPVEFENHVEKELSLEFASTSVVAPKLSMSFHNLKIADANNDITPIIATQKNIVRPYNLNELAKIYCSIGLNSIDMIVEDFLQQLNVHNLEFYRLLFTYFNARNDFVTKFSKLSLMITESEEFTPKFWTFTKHTIKKEALCSDGTKLSASINYEFANFNAEIFKLFRLSLNNLIYFSTSTMAMANYQCALSWLHVEFYLNQFFTSNALFENLLSQSEIKFLLSADISPELHAAAAKLREMISVLFSFLRRPITDDEFFKKLSEWINFCVNMLLKTATLYDHIFILNHVMRLPPKICSGFVNLVQLFIPKEIASNLFIYFDHLLTVLAMIFYPVRAREECLKEFKRNPTTNLNALKDENDQFSWILIDEDGEEDENPNESWHQFFENDLISLLNQVPFNELLCKIMENIFNKNVEGKGMEFLRMLAYFTNLLKVFSFCFDSYSLNRYKQLNKRIARLIKVITNFCIDLWLCIKSDFSSGDNDVLYQGNYPKIGVISYEKLNIELNSFILRAFNLILQVPAFGIWQYMAELSFAAIDEQTAWKTIYLMLNDNKAVAEDIINESKDPSEWCEILTDHTFVEQTIIALSFLEGNYLLSTLNNLALHRSSNDVIFIKFVAHCLFDLTYMNSDFRETYSKIGRELLSQLIVTHSFVVSVLLRKIDRHYSKLGTYVVYLFSVICLDHWLPDKQDIDLLLKWLVLHDITSNVNQLSRIILANIDWGMVCDHNTFAISMEIQMEVVNSIYQGYVKHLSNKEEIPESIKRPVELVTKNEPRKRFGAWCWQIILEMHIRCSAEIPPNIMQDIDEGKPFAMLITLMMVQNDTSLGSFCLKGLEFLETLCMNGYFRPCMRILFHNLPLHCTSLDKLKDKKNDFAKIFSIIANADTSFALRFVGINGVVGKNSELLASMICSLLHSCYASNSINGNKLLAFLLNCILTIESYWSNKNICFVLDRIVAVGFQTALSREIIVNRLSSVIVDKQNDTTQSGVFKLFSSGSAFTHIIPMHPEECPYLTYMSLLAHMKFEDDYNIWPNIVDCLTSKQEMSASTAVKKEIERLRLPFTFSSNNLSLLIIAATVNKFPIDHFITPLVWQLFFSRYFHRLSYRSGVIEKPAVGYRFFTGSILDEPIKRISKHLFKNIDYFNVVCKSQDEEEIISKSYRNAVLRFYKAAAMWLENKKLNDKNFSFNTLSDVYSVDILKDILTLPYSSICDIIFDNTLFTNSIIQQMKLWHLEVETNFKKPVAITTDFNISYEASYYRLQKNLKKLVNDPVQPPLVMSLSNIVPGITNDTIFMKSLLIENVSKHFGILNDFTSLCLNEWRSFHADVNMFIDLIPQQFVNKDTIENQFVNCTKIFNQKHVCAGPASFQFNFQAKEEVVPISTEIDRIWLKICNSSKTINRSDLKKAITSVKFIEQLIIHLINYRKSETSTNTPLDENGIALFYLFISIIPEDFLNFPPFKQTMTSCLEVLGYTFISENSFQQEHLLDVILSKPYMAPLVSSHFRPFLAGSRFVYLYEKIKYHICCKFDSQLISMLLTKFDIEEWLKTTQPPAEDRYKLMSCIVSILETCGKSPDEDHAIAFDLCRCHLKFFLSLNFEDDFCPIAKLLFESSLRSQICPTIWNDFFSFCGYANLAESIYPKTNSDQELLIERINYIPDVLMLDLTNYLKSKLMEMRMSVRLKDMYSQLIGYEYCILKLISFICFANCERTASACNSFMAPHELENHIENLWYIIRDLFSPFLSTLYASGSNQVLQPFYDESKEWASLWGQHFIAHIRKVFFTFDELNFGKDKSSFSYKSILNLFLYFYIEVLMIPFRPREAYGEEEIPERRISVIEDRGIILQDVYAKFIDSLPWDHFQTDYMILRLMHTSVQRHHYNVRYAILSVFSQINWETQTPSLLYYCEANEDKMNEAFHYVLNSFVFLSTDPQLIEKHSSKLEEALRNLLSLDFLYVSDDYFDISLAMYLKRDDTNAVLRIINKKGLLYLLERICGLYYGRNAGSLQMKEIYLRRTLNVLKKVMSQPELVSESLLYLLNGFARSLDFRNSAASEIMYLFSPFVTFINECAFSDSYIVFDTFRTWTSDEFIHPLLLMCLTKCSQELKSNSMLPGMYELFIDSYFLETSAVSWNSIIDHIDFPYEISLESDFFENAVNMNCCYSLYAFCRSSSESQAFNNVKIFPQLLSWIDRLKPTKLDEHKIILLFTLMGPLASQQINRDITQCYQFLQFYIHLLCNFMEDKDSSGLLGKIGLGRKSPLSLVFRVSCRFIIYHVMQAFPDLYTLPSVLKTDCRKISLVALEKSLEDYTNYKSYPDIAEKVKNILTLTSQLNQSFLNDYNFMLKTIIEAFFSNFNSLMIINSDLLCK